MYEQNPLTGKGILKTPTISATINSAVVNVTVAASHLSGVAVQHGDHVQTDMTQILEQRVPMAGTGRWLQHDIQVNTEYSQPVLVGPDPLFGKAALFGNHTSSDLTMAPEQPHQVQTVLFEPTISVVSNPIDDVIILPSKQTARVALNTPTVKTRSYVYPDTLEAVAVQKTPVMEFGVNVYPAAAHLSGVAVQKTVTIVKVGSVNIQPSCLSAKASQKTATVRFEATISAGLLQIAAVERVPSVEEATGAQSDCNAATAALKTPAIHTVKHPIVIPNRLVMAADLKSATIYIELQGAVHPGVLIATGGMRTPALYDVHIHGLLKVAFAGSTPNIVYTGTRPDITFVGVTE
jgi:hypothetical protein